jgi:hypothetical protein
MPATRAERLCPDAVFVPPDFPRYRVTEERLKKFDVLTVADLRKLDLATLESQFGRYAWVSTSWRKAMTIAKFSQTSEHVRYPPRTLLNTMYR